VGGSPCWRLLLGEKGSRIADRYAAGQAAALALPCVIKLEKAKKKKKKGRGRRRAKAGMDGLWAGILYKKKKGWGKAGRMICRWIGGGCEDLQKRGVFYCEMPNPEATAY